MPAAYAVVDLAGAAQGEFLFRAMVTGATKYTYPLLLETIKP